MPHCRYGVPHTMRGREYRQPDQIILTPSNQNISSEIKRECLWTNSIPIKHTGRCKNSYWINHITVNLQKRITKNNIFVFLYCHAAYIFIDITLTSFSNSHSCRKVTSSLSLLKKNKYFFTRWTIVDILFYEI